MEPLSALGFAVNILTLVELSAKLLSKGNAIFKSANGSLEENDRLGVIATRLRDLTTELEKSIGTTLDHNELALIAISRSCMEISHQISQKLAHLAVCGSITRFKSYRQALKSVWQKDEIDALASKLEMFRGELNTCLLLSLR